VKVDGINATDLFSNYAFVDQMGLDDDDMNADGVDKTNNKNQRYGDKKNWRAQDLPYMLNKLQIGQNKFFIMRLLKRGDIMALLGMLDKSRLVAAMNFFPRSKLLQFMNFLPKEMLLKMLLWVIPLKNLLQFFPTDLIFNILRSKRLEVGDMVKGFQNMPKEVLAKLINDITGENTDKMKHSELLGMLGNMKKEQILEGMKKMENKQIFEFVHQEVKKDPQLLMMIPKDDLMKVASMMPKPNLVELFHLLEESTLVTFLSQLPEKFMCLAAAQIDDKTFGNMLMSQYPDLIAQLASAA
jgi:hypothetical protein